VKGEKQTDLGINTMYTISSHDGQTVSTACLPV